MDRWTVHVRMKQRCVVEFQIHSTASGTDLAFTGAVAVRTRGLALFIKEHIVAVSGTDLAFSGAVAVVFQTRWTVRTIDLASFIK